MPWKPSWPPSQINQSFRACLLKSTRCERSPFDACYEHFPADFFPHMCRCDLVPARLPTVHFAIHQLHQFMHGAVLMPFMWIVQHPHAIFEAIGNQFQCTFHFLHTLLKGCLISHGAVQHRTHYGNKFL
ncbi:hypothetical protein, unlikely [Trypanosoma congolense IL3000]|uniref:Uncharacterized protein n=1 Tax=Trypanosoma congolense (strain IL3000) TaxID=1068625 RepID=F9W8E3_TRYCI|nr:hypothetical protein, unlikely [Trypanosoma congolense IL3000]